MGKATTQIRALALNAFQEVLRKRVLYVAAILIVLVAIIIFSQIKLLEMAGEAGESTGGISGNFVQQTLGLWNFAASLLALFLRAVGLSSEITAKTIVHILSRPVDRTVYLAGRWLGVLAFLWAFELLGISLSLLIARIFDVHFAPIFWAGCAEVFVNVAFLSGISLGLSVVIPPVLAGSCAFLLTIVSGFLGDTLHHPQWILRILANAAYYLLPARMPEDLIAESFQKELLHPNFALYFQIMAENLGYTVVVFAIACVIFARRELRLR
jgi:ABC-type transport system involved in multi-copper enzyme maturation permease subunit